MRAWVGGGMLVKNAGQVIDFFPLHRYISTYLNVQERDPKAHRFLGQIYEAEGNVEKAFGCYKVSTTTPNVLLYSFKTLLWQNILKAIEENMLLGRLFHTHLTMEST